MRSRGFSKFALAVCFAVFIVLLATPVFAFAATPHQVTGLKVARVTATSDTLTWSKASHATRYYVYYQKTTSTSWTYAGRTSSTVRSFTKKSLSTAASYRYKVRAYNGRYGKYSSVATDYLRRPAALTGLTGNFSNGTLELKWNKSSGAALYRVSVTVVADGTEYTVDETKTASVATTGTIFYALTPLDDPRLVSYTVVPVSSVNVSGPGTTAESTYQTASEVFMGTLLPTVPSDSPSVVRFSSSGAEVVATYNSNTSFTLNDENGNNEVSYSEFRAAAEASPTALAECTVIPYYDANGVLHRLLTYVYLDVAPATPVVEEIYGEGLLVSFVDPVITLSDGEGRNYSALVGDEALFSIDDAQVTEAEFFEFMAVNPDAPLSWNIAPLDAPTTVGEMEISYYLTNIAVYTP